MSSYLKNIVSNGKPQTVIWSRMVKDSQKYLSKIASDVPSVISSCVAESTLFNFLIGETFLRTNFFFGTPRLGANV